MSQATDYLETKVLNGLLGGTNVTFNTKPYIGLLKSAPSDSSGGTEVSGTNYARVQCGASNQGDFVVGSTGSASNTGAFTFNDAQSNWGTVTHVGLYDSATSGNLLGYGALNTSADIQNGDIFKIPTSGFTVSVD